MHIVLSFTRPLATMTQCAIPQCTAEGTSQCSRCKSAYYCGADCQKKDWSSHKRQCEYNDATPNTIAPSPYAYIYNIFSGRSTPLSTGGDFFSPTFGYTEANPALVYADLVSAYRILRLGAHANAARVSAELQGMSFEEWMARVARVGLLPEWWNAEVHGTGIETYASKDAWGRIDRAVTVREICESLPGMHKCGMVRLALMVERIINRS
ncbi:hypothetical protein B0H15DRAFT_841219 [Mycena belliarum]|uniref:MYND-type domain-containing protein n=1 Tax=Mycena belliarum TaxID=1033014 RepID=A0AAD6U542_9AGAR|nr:hypothetical protein B0H15DRAFT_841219 [Mycena belliae]